MGVFVVLLLIPLLMQHIRIRRLSGYHIDSNEKNRKILGFFFFFLTTLLALRHESIGNDTETYIYYFDAIKRISWNAIRYFPMEYGYVYLNKLVAIFTQEARVFFVISAILINALIYPTYKRLCEDASLTIVIYCILSTFVMMFSGIRQMMAIAIGFVAYDFTRNKKLIPYILSVVLAMLFHTSAFMLAFMYPLYHARITKKWLYAVVPIMAVIFIFNEQIFTFLGLFLELYTEFSGEIQYTGAYVMIVLFAIFTVFSYLIPDEKLLDAETIGLRNFMLLSLVIQMFAPLNALAMRMGYYYIIFIPLLIPKIIACRSKRWNQVALLARHVMVIFFAVYFFYNAMTSDSNLHVFPYHFFWETVE